MKITKKQLKRIIREEYSRVVAENSASVDDYRIQRQIKYLLDMEDIDHDTFYEGIEDLIVDFFGEQHRDRVFAMAKAAWKKHTYDIQDYANMYD